MARGARLLIRRQNAQRGEILVHLANHAVGEGFDAFAVFIGASNDLIVDIGNVAHVVQTIAAVAQVAGNHVERHEGAPMANMTEVVHRDTAHVHADFTSMDRFEFLFLSTQGVINL